MVIRYQKEKWRLQRCARLLDSDEDASMSQAAFPGHQEAVWRRELGDEPPMTRAFLPEWLECVVPLSSVSLNSFVAI